MIDNLQNRFLNVYDSLKKEKYQESFHRLVEALFIYYKKLWDDCDNQLDKKFHNVYLPEQKTGNKKQIENFLTKFIFLLQCLDKDSENESIKKDIRNLTDEFVNCSDFFNISISSNYPKDFILSTKYFIQKAGKFDSKFNFYDIFQALRNVWTMNLLQTILSKDVKMTYPIFGYSMLYPYTDNMLDSAHITKEEKRLFSDRLKRRLEGSCSFSLNDYEDKIFELVSYIEKTYPRREHYALYKSLQYINLSQVNSLHQYCENNSIPLDGIIELSFKKGGVSVLTDAYLVKGILNLEEIVFSFGLGIVLQLIDDLQDIKEDTKSNNMTIFTMNKDRQPMDTLTGKLINFTAKVTDSAPIVNSAYLSNIKTVLKQNCILMMFFSISRNSTLYSKDFIKNLDSLYPFPADYMKSFNSMLNNRCSKLRKLKNIKATDAFDILLDGK